MAVFRRNQSKRQAKYKSCFLTVFSDGCVRQKGLKMDKIVFATGNRGKLAEIKEIMEDYDIVSMADAGVDVEIEENGTTFEENALIKARSVWNVCKGLVMADDSGLEVDALGGEPGIYSARYLGEETPFSEKMDDILLRMKDVPEKERSARFVCALAAVFPDGTEKVVRGTMEGCIAYEKAGDKGFGYDPIVYIREKGMTVAQLEPEAKSELSHRGKALRLMKDILWRFL